MDMRVYQTIGLCLMRDHVHLPQNVQILFCKPHCLCPALMLLTRGSYCWSVCSWDHTKKSVLDHLIVPFCRLLKRFATRIISKNSAWLFPSEALDCLILSGSKVKLQPHVHFLQVEVTLILNFKSTLIAWFNFDPGHKYFNMGDYFLNKFVVPLSGHPVFIVL